VPLIGLWVAHGSIANVVTWTAWQLVLKVKNPTPATTFVTIKTECIVVAWTRWAAGVHQDLWLVPVGFGVDLCCSPLDPVR
jgi:hypothetical protein